MSKTLFSRNSKEHDDIWDDTLLIQAYEESIRLQKEEVAKELAMKTNSKRRKSENSESGTSSSSSNQNEEFKVGDFVRSTYEDGVDYEAEIISINENRKALIRYIGYGNEERVNLEDLVVSWGLEAREEQKLLAEADNPTPENEGHHEGLHQFVLNKTSGINEKLPVPPMPPMPPSVIDSTRDSEYMSAMLMSWYMSGYYTGLYHGRKEARQELTAKHQQQSLENKSPQSKDLQRKKQRKRNLNSKP